MPNLLTFGSEKDKLRMVVENGVDITDPRVLTRTNEATQLILKMRDPQTGATVIPVNGMMIVDIEVGTDSFFSLPPEMDSIVYFKTLNDVPVNGQRGQGWYNIVNPATYLEPGYSFDNPLVDHFFTSGQTAGTLRRRYFYPGFAGGTIRAVGPKAYMPIVDDSSILIVQNVPALKSMILACEYKENNQGQLYEQYYNDAREVILGEIKAHNMDPRWIQRRKADYENDLALFAEGSKGWTRARIALEVPGAMMVGREDIDRIIDRAQLRMMESGTFKGMLEEFNATIVDGHIYCPSRVKAIVGAALDGEPLDIRSMFFKYLNNGPGDWDWSCGGRLDDEGERYFADFQEYRRVYRARIGSNGSDITFAALIKWQIKRPQDQLVIRNLEANRLMAQSIVLEGEEKWSEAAAVREEVIGKDGILQRELSQYLAGIKHTLPSSVGGGAAGMSNFSLGEPL